MKQEKFHFVGIGGAGMSALALLLLRLGKEVSGSDLEMSSYAQRVKCEGGKIFLGHHPDNLGDTQVLIFSSAISEDNPEIKMAREKKILIKHRTQLLSDLIANKKSILISGTHGKTTTTNMIARALLNTSLQPSIVLGGESFDLKGNAYLGKSSYFVAEADESDASFLNILPNYAVITNIEAEHLNFYKNEEKIISAFEEFCKRVKDILFYNGDDENIKKILQKLNLNKKISFGFSRHCDIFADNLKEYDLLTSFDCFSKGKKLGCIEISLFGRYNVANCLAAIGLCLELGVDFGDLQKSFRDYKGVARRGEIKRVDGIVVVEDYAHHPTEIKAILSASLSLKKNKNNRIISIFQPHRYSRTKFLWTDFANCFDGADIVVLTNIYSANEKPIKGISSEIIYQALKKKEGLSVVFLHKKEIVAYIKRIVFRGDVILVLGAGDIGNISEELVQIKIR